MVQNPINPENDPKNLDKLKYISPSFQPTPPASDVAPTQAEPEMPSPEPPDRQAETDDSRQSSGSSHRLPSKTSRGLIMADLPAEESSGPDPLQVSEYSGEQPDGSIHVVLSKVKPVVESKQDFLSWVGSFGVNPATLKIVYE
jgi:hypothetical protein